MVGSCRPKVKAAHAFKSSPRGRALAGAEQGRCGENMSFLTLGLTEQKELLDHPLVPERFQHVCLSESRTTCFRMAVSAS